MSGGIELAGAIEPPRKRGRPKGSGNKRSKDLKGYVDARFGGSAAQQAAQLALVTRAELAAAGGSMAKAQVAKALDLVEHVRRAQEGRDEWLRQVVREELAGLADELPDDVVKAVRAAVVKIREATAGFGLKEALAMIGAERAALLPYTDQKQPLAIEAKGAGFAPSVVVQIESPGQAMPTEATDAEFVEVFSAAPALVARSKSHDEGQGAENVGELDLGAPD